MLRLSMFERNLDSVSWSLLTGHQIPYKIQLVSNTQPTDDKTIINIKMMIVEKKDYSCLRGPCLLVAAGLGHDPVINVLWPEKWFSGQPATPCCCYLPSKLCTTVHWHTAWCCSNYNYLNPIVFFFCVCVCVCVCRRENKHQNDTKHKVSVTEDIASTLF